jgi:hypothetical protein
VSTKLISKLLIVSSSKIRSQWILVWDGIDHDRLSLPLAQYVCRCHGLENYNTRQIAVFVLIKRGGTKA